MVAKELLLFSLFCGVGVTSDVLEERRQRSQCRKQTVFCPCKDRRGMPGHVLVVTCSDQNDSNILLCQGKALYSEECGKVNFSSKRHRRDTGNCMNGIIPGSRHTLDKDPQALMISGSSIMRHLDDRPTFKCQVHSNFSANITWLFNGKPLEKKWYYSFASCKRNLEVKYISKSDAGNYTCVVTNKKGKQASAHAKLIVNGIVAPVIQSVGLKHGNTAFIGTTVNITCRIEGSNPLVSGFFLKNGTPLHEDSEQLKYMYFHSKNSYRLVTLEIKNITIKDAGNYTCQVIQNDMNSSKTFLLKVEPCPAGFYCPPGGSGRIQCPQGTYQPNVSQTSEQACKPCPAGFYCPPKATGPVQCPMGTYQPNINQTSKYVCKQCTAGFYCPPGGSGRIQCPQGTYQPNIGQTSEQACKPCPAGFYCPPEATGPVQCPIGTYQPNINQTSKYVCKQCTAGFYCPPGGSGRIQCPQGTYQPNIGQTSEQACKPCPAGFYCPPEATGPVQCPIGTYQPNINQTSKYVCKQCTAGFYCPPGRSGPIRCPQGTYQPNISQTSEEACKPCPFFTNSSKNLGRVRPILDEADCPGEDPSKEITASTDVTKIAIGTAIGVVIILVLVFPLLFIAKKKRLLWFSSLEHRRDPECYTCQPILNGDTENAEGAEVLKTLPEIDYEAKHDVFICYCYKDVDWAKELLAELEKRGFKCCIDFKNFTVGETIVQNIAEAICFSKKTIAVLSPDFIKSDWCKDELHKALSRVRYHQVVPVMYKHCEIPFALRDTTYLDWENCNVKPYFWEQLEKALRKPNGEAYLSRRLQNGNQTLEVSARV